MNPVAYELLVTILLVCGLIPALIFLAQHRPRQWKRAAAWDASGLVIVVALWYIRGIVLIILKWPGSLQVDLADGLVSLVLLSVIDGLLILRFASYRAFVADDKDLEQTDGGHRPPRP